MPLRRQAPAYRATADSLLPTPGRLFDVLTRPLDDSRYLHWEKLVQLTPPDDLTHEEWWLNLKQRRMSQAVSVPLRQKNGKNFWFSRNEELLRLADEVSSRAGAPLNQAQATIDDRDAVKVLVRSFTEEAITSSQLEGASTSRREAVELLDSGRKPRDRSEQMIVNNVAGMAFVKDHATHDLTPDLVRLLHAALTDGTLDDAAEAGRIETPDHPRVGVFAASGEKVHTPPPASELPGRLQELCTFANADSKTKPFIPATVRAIIVHFMFGYDHYFIDGNGRTARAAYFWSMLHAGYWLTEFLSISRILREAPAKYSDAYQYTEDDDGDLTYFILHQLTVIVRALDELDSYIDTKQKSLHDVRQALGEIAGQLNFRQSQVIEWILDGSLRQLTSAVISRRCHVTTATAITDLTGLEHLGLLTRGRSRRPLVWTPVPDLEGAIHTLSKRG